MSLTAEASDAEKQEILNDSALVAQLADELSREDMLQVLGNLNAPIKDKLKEAMDGWGTDEATIMSLTAQATEAEKTEILDDRTLMSRFWGELSQSDMIKVMKNLVDVSALPEGHIQDATALLAGSEREVDRNTTQHIIDGTITAYYIEDLNQPDNIDDLIKGWGYDPSAYTVYLEPPEDTEYLPVQKNAMGFAIIDNGKIFGRKTQSIEDWLETLVHEVNHARNLDPTIPLEYYQSEFRAYWVEGGKFDDIEDEDDRAEQIKQHVLSNYPHIKAAYDADEAVRKGIDAHTRPDGNITNQ